MSVRLTAQSVETDEGVTCVAAWDEPAGCYFVHDPRYLGLCSDGKTLLEALDNFEDARREYHKEH